MVRPLRVAGHVGADGGNELGVAEEVLEVGLDVRIPGPDVSKRAGEAFERIRHSLPGLRRRERVQRAQWLVQAAKSVSSSGKCE